MLEEVGEAALPRQLIGGADVVPEVDRDLRDAMVLTEDHGEAVWQRVFLERNPGIERRASQQYSGQRGNVQHAEPLQVGRMQSAV